MEHLSMVSKTLAGYLSFPFIILRILFDYQLIQNYNTEVINQCSHYIFIIILLKQYGQKV
jgi:hypothetical protein